MTFSLCFQYVNARHFKSKIDIWGNFVPGMIFFQAIFGYLAICMLYKWSVDWTAPDSDPAPSLLNMLIYMFLSPGTIQERLYAGQGPIQILLLLIAVINVPILLLLKPLYLRYEHNKARRLGYSGIGEVSRVSALDNDDDATLMGNGNNRESVTSDREAAAMVTQDIDDGEHEEFEFSEEMIHQTIHTIGMISSGFFTFPYANVAYQSSVLIAYLTRLPTYVCGLCHWPINSCQRCCGQ